MILKRRELARVQFGVLGASAVAWIAIAASSLGFGQGGLLDALCSSTQQATWLAAGWILSASRGWLLMIVAMMGPMTLPAIVHIRISTFASRRARAVSLFLLGFLAVWVIPGLAMTALERGVRDAMPNAYAPAVLAALVACVWHVSPFKQWCLNRCHAHRPLSPFGLKADVDALRLGLRHGLWCIGTCWPLMLATVLLPRWQLAAMVVVSVLAFCERLDPPRIPAWRLRGFRTAGLWLRREIVHVKSRVLRHRGQRPARPARERGLI
ncbi:copper chaperone [Burkholderia stagnalis]